MAAPVLSADDLIWGFGVHDVVLAHSHLGFAWESFKFTLEHPFEDLVDMSASMIEAGSMHSNYLVVTENGVRKPPLSLKHVNEPYIICQNSAGPSRNVLRDPPKKQVYFHVREAPVVSFP